MQIQIASDEAGLLLGRLSELTGETAEEAVTKALRERFDRLIAEGKDAYKVRLLAIADRVAAMPELDARTEDEILGYNEHGLFG